MREVSWVPLSAALAKMSADRPFIDDWQREELGRCGLHQRELPLVTEEILRQLQAPRYLVITHRAAGAHLLPSDHPIRGKRR